MNTDTTAPNFGTAPRITPEDIEDAIAETHVFTAAQAVGPAGTHQSLGLLTICVLVLRNGFTVTGTSACASPENFDAAIGRNLAIKDAMRQVWPLEGYLLKEHLFEHGQSL